MSVTVAKAEPSIAGVGDYVREHERWLRRNGSALRL